MATTVKRVRLLKKAPSGGLEEAAKGDVQRKCLLSSNNIATKVLGEKGELKGKNKMLKTKIEPQKQYLPRRQQSKNGKAAANVLQQLHQQQRIAAGVLSHQQPSVPLHPLHGDPVGEDSPFLLRVGDGLQLLKLVMLTMTRTTTSVAAAAVAGNQARPLECEANSNQNRWRSTRVSIAGQLDIAALVGLAPTTTFRDHLDLVQKVGGNAQLAPVRGNEHVVESGQVVGGGDQVEDDDEEGEAALLGRRLVVVEAMGADGDDPGDDLVETKNDI